MAFNTILYELKDNICIVTLNRPKFMNAIDEVLAQELGEALDRADKDTNIRVLIITGGNEFFCTGADLKNVSMRNTVDFLNKIRRSFHLVETLSKPVIAAINGAAVGGGLELALTCDMIVVSDTAKIGLPEVNIGRIPGAGGTQRLVRSLGIIKAKELLYLGRFIDGNEAYRIGLVNCVAGNDEVINEALKLATELAQKAPLSLKSLKRLVYMSVNVDIESGLDEEIQHANLLATSNDFEEGRKSFIENRKPIFKGE